MQRCKTLTIALFSMAALPFISEGADRRQLYEQLTAASDKVVVGTVGMKTSRWGEDSRIYTDVVVNPETTLKGDSEGAFVVQLLGGTIGDVRMEASGGPDLPDGERVVLFLKRGDNHYEVMGRSQGAISASAPEAQEAIDSALAQSDRSTRQGRAAASVSGASSAPTAEMTRQDAALQVGCYVIDGIRWNGNSATYRINASVPAAWTGAIDAAAAAWNGAGAAFQFVKDQNSSNEFFFADLGAIYGPAYANEFAITQIWFTYPGTRIIRAATYLNSRLQWSTSGEAGKVDVQNEATHQFGHWLRLLDVNGPATCSEVTMWTNTTFGETKKRTLEPGDVDGIKALYGSGGGLSAPVLVSPANGATGVSTTPTLDWNPVAGATAYDIYFGTANNPGYAATTTNTAVQAGPLSPGVTYFWRIVARNGSTTATSSVYSFTTASASSNGPTLLSPANGATGVQNWSVFQWTAVQNASFYDIYLGSSPNTLGLIARVNQTSVRVGGFAPGATYYWKIVAWTPNGQASSQVWSFTAQ